MRGNCPYRNYATGCRATLHQTQNGSLLPDFFQRNAEVRGPPQDDAPEEMGVMDAARTPFDVEKVRVAAEEAKKAARFRRKAGRGDGLSEELYQRIRTKLLRGELPPTVAAIKRVARGTKRTYLVIRSAAV
jgi:hypothetical protein